MRDFLAPLLLRRYLIEESRRLREFVTRPLFDEKVILTKDPAFPRISIILPSYNQGAFLERTILSVLNQNYPNLELIIIDGGSVDGSMDIIKRYRQFISYWVSETDEGQTNALNKGFRIATGDIIGWQNSDDIYFPEALRLVGEIFKQDSSVLLLSGTIAVIDEDDCIRKIKKFVRVNFHRLLYEGYGIISSQGVFWRRGVHEAVGYFDPSLDMAMDFDFWLRVLSRGKAAFVPQVLGAFRRHSIQKSSMHRDRTHLEANKIRAKFGVDGASVGYKMVSSGLLVLRVFQWYFTYSHRFAAFPWT